MNSYLGVSHLDYPNDLEGFQRALGRVELWPMIGFFIPIGALLFTRGLDITWVKGVPPPNWYGWLLAISGFGYPTFYIWMGSLTAKLLKKMNITEDVPFSSLLSIIFKTNSIELWNFYYRIKYVGGVTIFLITLTMSGGICFLIYFVIGRI